MIWYVEELKKIFVFIKLTMNVKYDMNSKINNASQNKFILMIHKTTISSRLEWQIVSHFLSLYCILFCFLSYSYVYKKNFLIYHYP